MEKQVEKIKAVIKQLGGNPVRIIRSPKHLQRKLKITTWYSCVDINKLKRELVKQGLATDVYYTGGIKGTLNTIIALV